MRTDHAEALDLRDAQVAAAKAEASRANALLASIREEAQVPHPPFARGLCL
jgi:hypothetical protein